MPSGNQYAALVELCSKRKSTRSFSSRPVAREDVERILEVARTSPYASGRSNWEILVVDEPAMIKAVAGAVREKTGGLVEGVREDMRESFDAYSGNFSAFEGAPLLLIPCFRATGILSMMLAKPDAVMEQIERDSAVKSISCVAMLILLAAESLGLGACFMTGPLVAEDAIARILAVKPGRNIGAIIPVGYPREGG